MRLCLPARVIRAKYHDGNLLAGAPETFKSAPVNARGYPGAGFTLQFHVEDCTGCALCIEACPVRSPVEPGLRAINMADKAPLISPERASIALFETIPVNDRSCVDFANVRGVLFLEPLFEFSGACAGCGETPYVKLLSQLFGDRLMVANATGCSSIYSGNLLAAAPLLARKPGAITGLLDRGNPQQTLQAFREAEAYEEPSLILAYSHCIAHGFDIRKGLDQQDRAVASGYWPLLRYDPRLHGTGASSFRLDSPRPTLPFKDYACNDLRYSALAAIGPDEAAALLAQAQQAIHDKYRSYGEFAQMDTGPGPSQVLGAAGKL